MDATDDGEGSKVGLKPNYGHNTKSPSAVLPRFEDGWANPLQLTHMPRLPTVVRTYQRNLIRVRETLVLFIYDLLPSYDRASSREGC